MLVFLFSVSYLQSVVCDVRRFNQSAAESTPTLVHLAADHRLLQVRRQSEPSHDFLSHLPCEYSYSPLVSWLRPSAYLIGTLDKSNVV